MLTKVLYKICLKSTRTTALGMRTRVGPSPDGPTDTRVVGGAPIAKFYLRCPNRYTDGHVQDGAFGVAFRSSKTVPRGNGLPFRFPTA